MKDEKAIMYFMSNLTRAQAKKLGVYNAEILYKDIQSVEDLRKYLDIDPTNIRFLDQNDELQIYALEKAYSMTDSIVIYPLLKSPSEKVQIKAVSLDPFNLRYIFNPSTIVQKYAIAKHKLALNYIDNVAEEIISIVNNDNGDVI